jgi:hypothetical protein
MVIIFSSFLLVEPCQIERKGSMVMMGRQLSMANGMKNR